MPELSVLHIVVVTGAAIVGIVLGWAYRGSRAEQEKSAVNAGWQEQLKAKETEHARLASQNKALMEQVAQFQASHKDSKMRARELSDALKEAFERRDELQREIKKIRSKLEASVNEKTRMQSEFDSRAAEGQNSSQAIAEKDELIAKLGAELRNWHDRLPPLVERFRRRDDEAERLEAELTAALERIKELEALPAGPGEAEATAFDPTQTRVEPVRDHDALTDGLDASNEPIETGGREGADVNALRDDLKRIKGIGPAIEKTLNEMGIFRFSQIAEMSEYDIDRIARRLKGLHTRIYSEDWMGQARNLHDEKLKA